MTEERFLERLTWPEVETARARGVDAVLIPIGSTEQHGQNSQDGPGRSRTSARGFEVRRSVR